MFDARTESLRRELRRFAELADSRLASATRALDWKQTRLDYPDTNVEALDAKRVELAAAVNGFSEALEAAGRASDQILTASAGFNEAGA